MRLKLLLLIAILLTPLPTYGAINSVEDANRAMIDRWSIEENIGYEVDALLTFYTDLASCNSYENKGKNAIGGYLTKTSIAIPRKSMPFGSEITLSSLPNSLVSDYGDSVTYKRIADDVGSTKYIKINSNGSYRLDVFCPRLYGETDREYKARINSYGVHSTTAIIYERDGDS